MSPPRQTNVLQVISANDIGGGQRHLLTLLEWFKADSTYAFATICRPGGVLGKRVERLGVPVSHLALGDFFDVVSVYRLYKMLKSGTYHLVHAHLNRACLYASVAARLAGVPVVTTAHGLTKTLYYRFATRIIAVSKAVRTHLATSLPQLADRIQVIHNGVALNTQVDRRLINQFKQKFYIKEGERIVGVLGKFHPNKGQEVALRALKKIPAQYNVRLILAGEGPAKTQCEQLASLLSLGTRVLFLPHTDYVNEFLTMCDLVLVPSIKEAFSLVLLEALLMSRPIVASDTGGIPEIIQHGKNGLLFPPGDADRLAKEIQYVFDNERVIERMAAEGPSHVLQNFTHNRMGNETRALYKQVLDSARKPPS